MASEDLTFKSAAFSLLQVRFVAPLDHSFLLQLEVIKRRAENGLDQLAILGSAVILSPQNGISCGALWYYNSGCHGHCSVALTKSHPTDTTMSSLFGLAEQVLSTATGGSSESQPRHTVHKTGGHEYNSPHNRQQPQGGYDTDAVLSHADDVDEDSRGYIANAIQHVHSNPQKHAEQVDESDLAKYGPMIFSALSSASSKSGLDVGSLVSGGLGGGGGNQLMGLVMKQAGNAFTGGGGEEKQSMMNGAAMTLTKLVVQKQLSAFIGGSNSGGLSMLEVGQTLLKSRFG